MAVRPDEQDYGPFGPGEVAAAGVAAGEVAAGGVAAGEVAAGGVAAGGVAAGGVAPGERDAVGQIVEFGSPTRPRWLGVLALTCLVVAAVAVAVTQTGSHRPPPSQPVSVTSTGHPILGVRAGWELFGLDQRGLVRIRFARGQIVRTLIPPIQGDGIISLVAARGEVLLRPLDPVPGYLVPDGRPARPLAGILAQGGTLLPGPSPAEQWLESQSETILLVGPGGKADNAAAPILARLGPPAEPPIADGRGGLVLAGSSQGVDDVTQRAVRSIDALLLATGPRYWLGLSCDQSTCRAVVISPATGSSHALPVTPVTAGFWPDGSLPGAGPWPDQTLPGVVSPDGSVAAVIIPDDAAGQASLELINMTTGTAMRVAVPVAGGSSSDSLAWSPDSRWLFAVTAHGTLVAVAARTGQVHNLGLGLSGLSQIVIRPASG